MEKQKIYKAKNKERIREYQAEYRKNNPPDKEIRSIKYKQYYEKRKNTNNHNDTNN